MGEEGSEGGGSHVSRNLTMRLLKEMLFTGFCLGLGKYCE